jgi:hypothetical protein
MRREPASKVSDLTELITDEQPGNGVTDAQT